MIGVNEQQRTLKNGLWYTLSPSSSWPRTSPSHGGNTGSNPVGDAIKKKSKGQEKGTKFLLSFRFFLYVVLPGMRT